MPYFSGYYTLSVCALVLLVFSALAFNVVPLYSQNQELELHQHRLTQEILVLKKQIENYKKQIQAIDQNPEYVEFLLRNYLHYGEPGEDILLVPRTK